MAGHHAFRQELPRRRRRWRLSPKINSWLTIVSFSIWIVLGIAYLPDIIDIRHGAPLVVHSIEAEVSAASPGTEIHVRVDRTFRRICWRDDQQPRVFEVWERTGDRLLERKDGRPITGLIRLGRDTARPPVVTPTAPGHWCYIPKIEFYCGVTQTVQLPPACLDVCVGC